MRRLLLSLQSAFPVKLYHPEEDPTVGQISEKDVQHTTNNKINSKINELGDKLL